MCKFFLVLHCNYVAVLHCFWNINRRTMACPCSNSGLWVIQSYCIWHHSIDQIQLHDLLQPADQWLSCSRAAWLLVNWWLITDETWLKPTEYISASSHLYTQLHPIVLSNFSRLLIRPMFCCIITINDVFCLVIIFNLFNKRSIILLRTVKPFYQTQSIIYTMILSPY